MREYVVTVTRKGRLTLPAAVRRQLRIDAGDRVSIVIEDDNNVRTAPNRARHYFGPWIDSGTATLGEPRFR